MVHVVLYHIILYYIISYYIILYYIILYYIILYYIMLVEKLHSYVRSNYKPVPFFLTADSGAENMESDAGMDCIVG